MSAVAFIEPTTADSAAISAGVLIVWAGYDVMFLTLATIAGLSFFVYWVAMPETKLLP